MRSEGALRPLGSSLPIRGATDANLDYDGPRSILGHLRAFSGRVENGPRGAGNTTWSLTHPDRLNRSEGCREGYPSAPAHAYWFRPMSGGRYSARRPCPADRKRAVLEYQGYVCVYCAVPFGSVICKRGRFRVSSSHLDHFVPLAYLNSNPARNWVAACNFCNIVKSDLMFTSLADARSFILDIRDSRGDYVAWYADVSCEENPQRWAVKFASFLVRLGPGEQIDDTEDDETEFTRAQNRAAALHARRLNARSAMDTREGIPTPQIRVLRIPAQGGHQ